MLRAGSAISAAKVQARAEKLPFRDGAYDVALCANLLHHLDEPLAAVCEMARVARRHVVLIEPNALNPLMALFGAVVPRERGTLKFTARYTRGLGDRAKLRLRAFATQGAVVPNKTPESALPLLRHFDAPNPLGLYHVAVFDVGVSP
jgi:ubiquinone/menaquinone biosynthesis C-methylase UbiE